MVLFFAAPRTFVHTAVVYTDYAPCGLQGCKNRPATFPGRMS